MPFHGISLPDKNIIVVICRNKHKYQSIMLVTLETSEEWARDRYTYRRMTIYGFHHQQQPPECNKINEQNGYFKRLKNNPLMVGFGIPITSQPVNTPGVIIGSKVHSTGRRKRPGKGDNTRLERSLEVRRASPRMKFPQAAGLFPQTVWFSCKVVVGGHLSPVGRWAVSWTKTRRGLNRSRRTIFTESGSPNSSSLPFLAHNTATVVIFLFLLLLASFRFYLYPSCVSVFPSKFFFHWFLQY